MTAYPASFADGDWFAVFPFVSFISIKRMLSGVYMYARCNHGVGTDGYFGSIEDNSSEINENVISSIDVVTVVTMERRFYMEVFCSVWTEFTNNILKFICIILCYVKLV